MFANTPAPLPEILKHIDYKSLSRLCQTSRKYADLCRDPATWIFLLKRDFDIDFQDHPTRAGNIYDKIISDPIPEDRAREYKVYWDLRPKFRKLEDAIKRRDVSTIDQLTAEIWVSTPTERFCRAQFLKLFYSMDYYFMDPKELFHVFDIHGEFMDTFGILVRTQHNRRWSKMSICFLRAWIRYAMESSGYTKIGLNEWYREVSDLGPGDYTWHI